MIVNLRKPGWFGLMLLLVIVLLAPWPALAAPAKNVIILLTDGTASSHITLARWYKGEPLALDEILSGAVRTYSADSLITDSAPAATAYATGYKTNSRFLGILPNETNVPGVPSMQPQLRMKPVATILEAAKLAGKSVGLVATSNLQHASPAAFSSHIPYRDRYDEIAEQQVHLGIDVAFGGGRQYLLPKAAGGSRHDGKDLIKVLNQRGYQVITKRSELFRLHSGKVWGLFAPAEMAYDFDRKVTKPQEPSLAEMTEKAIELLSQNKNGFFLFIEASKVDWAAHANDPVGVISELLAYDAAVQIALKFAKQDGRTLVIAVADHGTGGLTIGSRHLAAYDKTPYAAIIEPLKQANLTAEATVAELGRNFSQTAIKQTLATCYGIRDITPEELALIEKTGPNRKLITVIGHMLSKRSGLGWMYGGHTGEDVFLYSYGPGKPYGLIENTDIAKASAAALGISLTDADKRLFVDAAAAFPTASFRIETGDSGITLVAATASNRIEFPVNTNIMKINETAYELEGITVHIASTGKTFIPAHAAAIAKTVVR